MLLTLYIFTSKNKNKTNALQFPFHHLIPTIFFFFFTMDATNRTNRIRKWHVTPYAYTRVFIQVYEKLRILSTLSMTSNAFMRSMSKSITGMEFGLRNGNGSFLVSLVGEWLLLLLSLWCLLNLVFAESNS